MTQQADDKELMAAFAEFKELLQRETEPVGASKAPAVSLALEANAATPDGAALEAPRLVAVDAPAPRAPAHNFAPPPIAPALGAADGWSAASSDAAEPIASDDETSGGRRKLIYLSVAVVAIGVASLGWTLTKWRPAEDPAVADLSLPAEPEASTPGADQAALEPPAAEPAKDALPAVEAATTNNAEAPPPPVTEAPAREQAQPAEAPTPETAASLPEAAAPQPAPAPRQVDAVSAPPAAAEAVAPIAAATTGAAAAPLASTGVGAATRLTPPSAPRTAALPPANRFAAPEPAPPAAEPVHAAPKAPAPPKVAKPKPKPAPAVAKHTKPHPAPAERAPVASAAPVAPAPEPVPAPTQAPPQNDGGPFGFVKRTLNTVGSTISGVTRTVMPQ